MGGKMPSVQPTAPPPTIPKEETLTEEEKRAKENEKRRQKLMTGRTETILTSELGTSGTSATKASNIAGL